MWYRYTIKDHFNIWQVLKWNAISFRHVKFTLLLLYSNQSDLQFSPSPNICRKSLEKEKKLKSIYFKSNWGDWKTSNKMFVIHSQNVADFKATCSHFRKGIFIVQKKVQSANVMISYVVSKNMFTIILLSWPRIFFAPFFLLFTSEEGKKKGADFFFPLHSFCNCEYLGQRERRWKGISYNPINLI